eukprot:1160070-Pelagomonas_calceolata.AAC.5
MLRAVNFPAVVMNGIETRPRIVNAHQHPVRRIDLLLTYGKSPRRRTKRGSRNFPLVLSKRSPTRETINLSSQETYSWQGTVSRRAQLGEDKMECQGGLKRLRGKHEQSCALVPCTACTVLVLEALTWVCILLTASCQPVYHSQQQRLCCCCCSDRGWGCCMLGKAVYSVPDHDGAHEACTRGQQHGKCKRC